MENWQILLISIGVPLLVSGLYNFFWQRMTTGRQEKKEKLARHFDDLQNGAIKPISDIVANINIKNGSIFTNSPGSFDWLDSEQLECFQGHYPALADKWQELAGKGPRHQGLTGCRWTKQNEKARAFENKIEKSISKMLTEAGITLPIKPYQIRQELIDRGLPETIQRTLYEQAQGKAIVDDFSKAAIIEDDFYVLQLGKTKLVNAKNSEVIEKCKSIFIDVQNSEDLRKEASSVIRNAEKIRAEFEELLSNLAKIKSRGFISKDPKYEFKVVKRCPICKELFY